eukprot:594535-Pyramimonas_sp.AAC.1
MSRVMVARSETWGATFLTSSAGMLEPRERLAISGTMEQVAWVGGDATLEAAGQIDWAAKVYARQELAGYMDALKAAAGLPEDWVIIALGELFCIVGFA